MTSEKTIARLVDNPLLKYGDELVRVDYSRIDDTSCLPTYMDIGLGDQYDYIDLDENAIAARMKNEGMTNRQIARTGIWLSADVTKRYNLTMRGGYWLQDGVIVLYPNGAIQAHKPGMIEDLREDARNDPGLIGRRLKDAPEVLSQELSTVLYHELRHAKQHLVDGTLKETVKNSLPESVDAYLVDPFEVDARAAGEEAPGDVVRLQPKQPTITVYRHEIDGLIE